MPHPTADREAPPGQVPAGIEDAPCVLVVEAAPALRDLYRSELEASGYPVVTAGSGEEALAWLETAEAPGAMVLDIQLGGMDGIQLMRRALQRHPRLPVLLHTTHTHYKDNVAAWCADPPMVPTR